MRAVLTPLFGEVPPNAENLEIVGSCKRRFEEQTWTTIWPDSGVVRWADGSPKWKPSGLRKILSSVVIITPDGLGFQRGTEDATSI